MKTFVDVEAVVNVEALVDVEAEVEVAESESGIKKQPLPHQEEHRIVYPRGFFSVFHLHEFQKENEISSFCLSLFFFHRWKMFVPAGPTRRQMQFRRK